MSLSPGVRLGPYEIIAPVGAGGMGEVYRAKDSNLKRSVAIKVLPAAMARDADRLARFQREAEVLAALNHPNIAAIYGLEKTSELTALVMELVEGEELSTLIARGGGDPRGLKIDDALPIARQIAEALEAAHEQGVIHRDLKPANIKVRADGTVKVLDFGLAKAMDQHSPEAAGNPGYATTSPTMTSPAMTAMGLILGTAAYMAPEQARGKSVDKRADIWAFGIVLYEMLSGRRAFEGEEVSDVLAAVLRHEIDFNALPADTPTSVRRLIRRCLDRDLKHRLRDIGEARVVLENPASPLVSDATPAHVMIDVPPPAVPAPIATRAWPWATGVLAVALGLALWAPWRAAPAATAAQLRLTPLSFEQGGQTSAVWSPDGKAVAYGARQKDTDPFQVYVRYLDSPVATQITSNATGVLGVVGWIETGKIIFRSGLQLWSVSPVGGEPEPWNPAGPSSPNVVLVGAGSVSRDGAIAAGYCRSEDGGLNVWITPTGSSLKPYDPAPFASRTSINTPSVSISPDGTQILLLRNAGAGEEAWLLPYPASAAKPPHRILQSLTNFNGTPAASWMPDNRHVVLSASPNAGPRQLYLADTMTGAVTPLYGGTRSQNGPAVSPDGSKLVFVETETDRDVVSVDLATAAITPVIATQRAEQMPAWASRERALVYVTDRNGPLEIWLRKPSEPDRPLVTSRDFPPDTTRGFMGPTLSPDGSRVIYRRLELGPHRALWISAVAGGQPVKLLKSEGNDQAGSWSPDGNWYVYAHDQDDRTSLNKVKTNGGAEPEVLKTNLRRSGNWVPLWSPANDWILYFDNGAKLISTDGKNTRDVSATSAIAYAFSADGRTIYGLRQPVALGRLELFAMSVAGGPEKTIGSLPPEYLPSTSLTPSIRLSLAPDGKSLTYSVARTTANLWLMDGLTAIAGH